MDEIQTLEISTQQKLLRVLNDGSYNRLGETKTHRSQFQLIAASTKDLDDEVEQGRFMVDIRTRMMGLDMHLLPLRKRKDEIPAFIALYLSRKGIAIDDNVFESLVEKLQTFHWSGNIRQLFKALDAWILTCEFDDLPLTAENFPIFKGMQEQNHKPSSPQNSNSDVLLAADEDRDYDQVMSQYEVLILSNALKRHSSIGAICKAMNISRSTLDARRRKFGL